MTSNSDSISMSQALYNHHLAEELWKEYLLHKTKENLDKFHMIVGAINSKRKDEQDG